MDTDDLLGDVWENKSTGLVLLKSSYLVAEYLRDDEYSSGNPATAGKMTEALLACQDNLDLEVFGETGAFDQPSLEELCQELSDDEKYALLIELRLADPFFPFQFTMTKKRDQRRQHSMREIAHRELHLSRSAADSVNEAMRSVAKAARKRLAGNIISNWDTKDWMLIVGSGALVAGAAVAAAPLVAIAMPAAAGLSGAAAVSAGLASIGGGSIATGGLGMAGGMWALGAGGAAVGSGVAGTTELALRGGDGAGLVQAEVMKLCMSFLLAEQGYLSSPTSNFGDALDRIHDEVRRVLATEKGRNEKGCERLKALESLDKTLAFAGDFMVAQSKPWDATTPVT